MSKHTTQELTRLLDAAIQDAAEAALAGTGVSDDQVAEIGPKVLDFVRSNVQSYSDLSSAIGATGELIAGEPGDSPPWRVAEVWSSSTPHTKIPWLATHAQDQERVEKHHSFIRWLSPAAPEHAKE